MGNRAPAVWKQTSVLGGPRVAVLLQAKFAELTEADYRRLARSASELKARFFTGSQPIVGRNLKSFLVQGLKDEPDLLEFLTFQALPQYKVYAIVGSGLIRRAIVHSDGDKTFISGGHRDTFIIGRRDGNQLGISSAFIPESLLEKLDSARKNICWQIRS